MRNLIFIGLLAGLLVIALNGCDTLFGSKSDETTDEIFREGRIDPTLLSDIGYVPLFPFFTQGAAGPFQSPRDVYVGYDEMIYVVDDLGLHVLDRAGRPANLNYRQADGTVTPYIPLREATSVIQDRRLHVYVTARRDTVIQGRKWDLPVVIRFSGISQGHPVIEDIIWYPFDDDSRKFNRPDPQDPDEQVAFTGVAVLPDNSIYVSRRGPINVLNTPIRPHNAILQYNPEGVNVRTISALHPTQPGLRSAVNPADVMTYIHPPQRREIAPNLNFMVAQSIPENPPQFSVLSILAVETPDGIVYRPDADKVRIALEADPEVGHGFLYEPFKFINPSDMTFAADGTHYIFVLDAGKDSLFVFNAKGVEGVRPPPGSRVKTPVVVSFGGTGEGPLQFRNPQGVAYFDKRVYVADTGNNRIARFILNTDLE